MKYGEKRFSVWRMEFLHPAIWHDHDIYFARWLHPAMWHVALGSWQWIHQVAVGLPCKVTRGSGMTCHWIRQVAAPCNVAGGSGMTCHWIRPNVRHIGILLLVSISTTSPQSTCHSAPVCEILAKSDHPRKKKIMSCRCSRWWISAILDFGGPKMGSLKSPCTTSYRHHSCKLLFLRKSRFFVFWRQTDERMYRPVAWSRSRCRERRLNNKRTLRQRKSPPREVCGGTLFPGLTLKRAPRSSGMVPLDEIHTTSY